MGLARTIDDLIDPLRVTAENIGAPLFDLAIRLYLANAFFQSGLVRLIDWKDGNFAKQIRLFDVKYPVPGIDPETAAYMTTIGSTLLPFLIAVGLFARFGAAGLLIMTAVIEFTYIHSVEHILWAFLAASIFIKGPGTLSIDHLIYKKLHY